MKQPDCSVTLFMLMAQFGGRAAVPLNELEEMFGMSKAELNTAAINYKLPVPTFRLRDSQKSPRMVHLQDLAHYIDKALEEKRKEFNYFHGRAA